MYILYMWNILQSIETKTAIDKLLIGPAKEVRIISLLGCWKLKGSMGTGLAQPIVGIPVRALKRGSKTVPIRSVWAKGFKVNRPKDRGVGSPSLSATNPWENSWMVIARIKIKKEIIFNIFQKTIAFAIIPYYENM